MRTAPPTTAFSEQHGRLLLELLSTPTVTPMEAGEPSRLRQAQLLYARAAAGSGFVTEHHQPAPASALAAPCVPDAVRELAERLGPEFLAGQPNLVLRLGPPREPARTVMINVHLDTVGGALPVGFRGGVFSGRGAVDMKGPAVAVLAGVELAVARRPQLAAELTVLLQCVGGEEGGAMGSYGTRVLVEAGYFGRLNVFAEPTGCRALDRATASMTARVEVAGETVTDDRPEAGHNATLLLGHIAAELGARLDAPVRAEGARLCIGGLVTGTTHDRVYGTGHLLINVAYPTLASGDRLARALEDALGRALGRFERRFAAVGVGARAADDAQDICRLRWLKRSLPALANRDPEMEACLERAGIARVPDDSADEPFTCDAIWAGLPGAYTIVFGPGSLSADGAHGPDEHVALAELDRYADALASLLLACADAWCG